MRTADVVDNLQRSGFSRNESLLLVSLARQGSPTASELAADTELNRVQVYRTLEGLEGRGFVDVSLERPKRYVPRPMDEIFDALTDERRSELEVLKTTRNAVLRAWPRLAREAKPPPLPVQIFKGRTQVYRAIRQFVGGARREVLAFTTTKGLQRSYREGINEVLLEAMKRGVEARLVVDIDRANVALMARVARRVASRHVDWQRGRFILFDRKSILAFLVQDERTLRGRAETALWTDSPDYVKAHLEIFEQGWSSGIPADERIKALQGSVA